MTTDHIIGAAVAAILVIVGCFVWLNIRDAKAATSTLQTQLQASNQQITALQTQLAATVAQINANKQQATTQTPQQIVREIPTYIPLPQPITIPAPTKTDPTPPAIIPAQDIQPLYDFGANCAICAAQLKATQSQLTDMTHQRDDAVSAAKGGSFWTRVKKSAKYIAIGAAIGAAGVLAAKR